MFYHFLASRALMSGGGTLTKQKGKDMSTHIFALN
jgi:hypothetical protein